MGGVSGTHLCGPTGAAHSILHIARVIIIIIVINFRYRFFEGERELLFHFGSRAVELLKLRPHGSDLLLQEQEKQP